MDNVVILQEIIHTMAKSKKKKGGVVFKLDLEKGYDSLDWIFLRATLLEFGFPRPPIFPTNI